MAKKYKQMIGEVEEKGGKGAFADKRSLVGYNLA